MNIGQVLHTRWAAGTTLNGLLAAAKVMTGRYFAEDPTFPYATITRPNDVPQGYTSDGAAVERVAVRITVYHAFESYDEGLAIADAVKSTFDREDFDLSGSDKVLNMQRSGYQEIQDEDGDWYFVIDFECPVHLSAGV